MERGSNNEGGGWEESVRLCALLECKLKTQIYKEIKLYIEGVWLSSSLASDFRLWLTREREMPKIWGLRRIRNARPTGGCRIYIYIWKTRIKSYRSINVNQLSYKLWFDSLKYCIYIFGPCSKPNKLGTPQYFGNILLYINQTDVNFQFPPLSNRTILQYNKIPLKMTK